MSYKIEQRLYFALCVCYLVLTVYMLVIIVQQNCRKSGIMVVAT
jgi:hypothetical protein